MIAAVALAVAAIGVILVIAATREAPPQPVAIPAVPAPQAASAACQALTDALPQRLGDYQRAPVTQPAPQSATAWRAGPDSQPVVLRCGLDRPARFVVGSPIQIVDRVQWFEVAAEQQSAGDAGRSTWYTVDRPVYVALTLPSGSGPTPIQQLSEVIDRTIAAVPINPAPAR
jgi:anti-sigma factor RsiW